MDIRILFISFVCIFAGVTSSSFSDFQSALDKAANDLNSINKVSAARFKSSVGLPQEDPVVKPEADTTKCGGWFSSKCETPTTTVPTTTAAPPTTVASATSESCGGWFQSACTTTTIATTTQAPKATAECGGWFQSSCEPTALSQTLTTTTAAPATTTTKNCGGWFGSACKEAVVTTTTATTQKPTTAAPSSCGGWFQSACKENIIPTTSAPKSCGGWFQSACVTTPPPVQTLSKSCGWFSSCPEETVEPRTASSGWIATIFTGTNNIVDSVKTTAGKAVDTALDVTSKIATTSMNTGIDFFLAQIKLFVRTTNMDVVSLPDLDIPLYPGASLKASGGYFKSVSSISRGGDIVISRDGLAFIIDFSVKLTNMEIGFKNYTIAVLMGMGTSGDIKVAVAENKINVRIRVALSTSCAINVEKVDFAVLDGLDIQMSYGCSYCGYVTDKATSYLANFLKNTIRLQIQGQIDSILKQTLSENALICSKFIGV